MPTKKTVTPPGVTANAARENDMSETPDAPVNVGTPTPVAPRVTASSRAKVSQTLEGVAAEYRRLNEGMDCRWVYHSATKPELSNVMSRTTEGYRLVEKGDLNGSNFPIDGFIDEKGHVRVADVVLMGIPTAQRAANAQARQRLADEQVARVKEQYRDSMASVTQGGHRAQARGAVKVNEVDHNLNYTQPDKE